MCKSSTLTPRQGPTSASEGDQRKKKKKEETEREGEEESEGLAEAEEEAPAEELTAEQPEAAEQGEETGGIAASLVEGPKQPTKVMDRAAAILLTQEKVKESKHKTACELTRRDFVPFIVSTDGCMGVAAQAFLRRMCMRLAEKWQRSYGQVFGFVKARMSVAILRASSQCLSGPCTRAQGAACVLEDGAALEVAQL